MTELMGTIGGLLFETDLLRKQLLRPRFLALGLTLGQGQPRVLAALYRKEPVTQRELAQTSLIEATTLSRTLDKMEEAGLVSRQRDPESRRSCLIRLTPYGTKVAQKVTKIFSDLNEKLLDSLSPEEAETLEHLLYKVRTSLTEETEQLR